MTKSLAPGAPRTGLGVQWMRIRNDLFDDRAWFARNAADLEPLPTSSPPQSRECEGRGRRARDRFGGERLYS